MTLTQAWLFWNLEHIALSGLDIVVDDPMFIQFKADGDRLNAQRGMLKNNDIEDVDMLNVDTGDVDAEDVDTKDVDTENIDRKEVD
ncbi:hypothetical protein MMC22_006932 [Lobaria immixta]|nr:hypothetical protein [Lobaria immixta]